MKNPTKSKSIKKRRLLEAYSQLGTITHAAKAAGINPCTHYAWMRTDPDYPAQFAEAHEMACDALEGEARRRAVEGWEELVFYEGRVVGQKRRYSDMMLAILLNAHLPLKYRNRVEHSGPNGGTLETKTTSVQIYTPSNRQNLSPEIDPLASTMTMNRVTTAAIPQHHAR